MQRGKQEIFRRERSCGFICVASEARRDFFENARAIVKNWCATVRARYQGELFCPGVDAKGGVRQRPDCMREAYELGRRLVAGRG
jgi:hypothetical protein